MQFGTITLLLPSNNFIVNFAIHNSSLFTLRKCHKYSTIPKVSQFLHHCLIQLTSFLVFWAQRSNKDVPEKNVIYLTFAVENVKNPVLDLTKDGFHFHSKADDKEFDLKLDFFDEIDPENSKVTHTDRGTFATVRKAKAQEEYWPRLTKEKKKYFFIKTDFDKWVDEDEQEEASADADDFDLGGGNPMAGMAGMPGMGGMGGMPGMPGMGGMGGMPGMGGMGGMPGMEEALAALGGNNSELLESLKADASAGGKDLNDLAKQYGGNLDEEAEAAEDKADETK